MEDLAEDYFEYKFVIRDTANPGQVLHWQSGDNMYFDFRRLMLTTKQLNLPAQIQPALNYSTPPVSIDRRTKLKLETSNPKSAAQIGDILVIIVNFE